MERWNGGTCNFHCIVIQVKWLFTCHILIGILLLDAYQVLANRYNDFFNHTTTYVFVYVIQSCIYIFYMMVCWPYPSMGLDYLHVWRCSRWTACFLSDMFPNSMTPASVHWSTQIVGSTQNMRILVVFNMIKCHIGTQVGNRWNKLPAFWRIMTWLWPDPNFDSVSFVITMLCNWWTMMNLIRDLKTRRSKIHVRRSIVLLPHLLGKWISPQRA